MTTLSIVIPVLGRHQSFETGLVSVLSERPDDSEVITVFAHEYGDPYDLKDEIRILSGGNRANWASLVNTGVLAAKGRYIHILQPGSLVEKAWTEPALDLFRDPRASAVATAVSPIRRFRSQRSSAKSLRSRKAGWKLVGGKPILVSADRGPRASRRGELCPHEGASFFRREDMMVLGGLNERLTATDAIVDLGTRLLRSEAAIAFDATAGVNIPAPTRDGSFARGYSAETLFLSYLDEVKSGRVVSRLVGGLPSMLLGAWGPFSGAARAIGRASAWLRIGSVLTNRRIRAEQEAELAALVDARVRQVQSAAMRKKAA